MKLLPYSNNQVYTVALYPHNVICFLYQRKKSCCYSPRLRIIVKDIIVSKKKKDFCVVVDMDGWMMHRR